MQPLERSDGTMKADDIIDVLQPLLHVLLRGAVNKRGAGYELIEVLNAMGVDTNTVTATLLSERLSKIGQAIRSPGRGNSVDNLADHAVMASLELAASRLGDSPHGRVVAKNRQRRTLTNFAVALAMATKPKAWQKSIARARALRKLGSTF
jgi:hypothetical protein